MLGTILYYGFLLSSLVFTLSLGYYTFLFYKEKRKYAHIPGLSFFIPPFLNPFLPKYQRDMPKRHIWYSQFVKKYGGPNMGVCKMQVGLTTNLFVQNMTDVKQVLISNSKDFSKGDSLDPLSAPFGPNIVSSDDNELWQRHRLLAGAALTHDSFLRHSLIEITDREMEKMFSSIESFQTGINVNISAATRALTMNVMGRAAFDHDFEQFSPDAEKAKTTHSVLDSVLLDVMLRFFFPGILWKLPIGLKSRGERNAERFRQLVKPIIEQKEKKLSDPNNTEKYNDLLSLMLLKKKELDTDFSEEELISNAFIFMFAGEDTSSSLIQFAFIFLCQYPKYQQKIQQEIDEICGRDRKPTYDDLEKMEFMKAFLKETLRMKPPVIGSSRVAHKKCVLKGSNVKVPAGTTIFININDRNRWGAEFEQPDKFDPSRFLDRKTVPCEFIPFMVGKRDCAGRHMAMTEVSYFFARFLQLYNVHMKEGELSTLGEKNLATLAPEKDIIVQLTQRV